MKGSSYKYFLAISLFFGLVYVFIVPPFQAPDEDNHFFRAYEISNPSQSTLPEPTDRLGAYLPSSLADYSNRFRYLRFNYDRRITKEKLFRLNNRALEKSMIVFTDFSNTAMYFPTAYPLQSVFAFIGASLDFSPATLLYLLRIATLITWLSILYLAFKIFPEENLLFLFIATLPSILVLHASITADALTNALSFLLFSFAMMLRLQKQKIKAKQIVYFGFIILIISINKIVYFPLILLWFLVPYGKFGSVFQSYASFLFIAGVCILLTSLWSLKVNEAYITYEEYAFEHRDDQQIKPGGNPSKQMAFVLKNPIDFTVNVVKSYASVVKASAAHLTGKFGWEKNYIPAWMIAILILVLLGLMTSNPFALSAKERGLLFIVVLAGLYLLAIVMYGIYSAVGNDYIHNLGGKYLFPLFPALVFGLSNRFLKLELSKFWILGILVLAHTTMIFSILNRYYF